MKQAEREDTWARVNAQAESVFKDDESMKGFLKFHGELHAPEHPESAHSV